MRDFEGISSQHLADAVSELEEMADRSPILTVAAVHVLKNELEDVSEVTKRRRLLHDRRFTLPRPANRRWLTHPREALGAFLSWLGGTDRESFRDRCDSDFWNEVVPVLERDFGRVAEPLMNTANEAVINYAEYSFRRWSVGRRVALHLFHTDQDLGYAIIRPLGSQLRVFDPLELKEKSAETLQESKRGWGHTLLMRRALFISFDRSPKRRGMMIVVGPEEG